MTALHFTTTKNADSLTTEQVVDALLNGKAAVLRKEDGTEVRRFKFPKPTRAQIAQPAIIIHGAAEKSLDRVFPYITGDAHDRSKVQWFDGTRFRNFFADPNEPLNI